MKAPSKSAITATNVTLAAIVAAFVIITLACAIAVGIAIVGLAL